MLNPAPSVSLSAAGYPLVLLRALRPKQWTKNLLLFAPLLFARAVFVPGAAASATLAVLCFCLLAGGVYVLNDWVDREQDRLHPEKCKRPIASGLIGAPAAFGLLAAAWGAAAALALQLGSHFALLAAGYIALQLGYSFFLKRIVILDVILIALGFVLRVAAGAAAIQVPVSNWLYLCTLLLAIFLGLAKRRHEVVSLEGDAGAHRANLTEYSVPMLDQMISIVAASAILAYGLYTVSADTVSHIGSDGLKFTVPIVIYGIFRYLYLIHRKNLGGSPEKVLLSDAPLILTIVAYVSLSAGVLYS